jgi:hypothetical protein
VSLVCLCDCANEMIFVMMSGSKSRGSFLAAVACFFKPLTMRWYCGLLSVMSMLCVLRICEMALMIWYLYDVILGCCCG